jgi:hypothetical protein
MKGRKNKKEKNRQKESHVGKAIKKKGREESGYRGGKHTKTEAHSLTQLKTQI